MEYTHKQAEDRLKDIADEIERLSAKDSLTPEDETYWSELVRESDEVFTHKVKKERDADREKVRALAAGEPVVDRSGNVTAIRIERGDEDHVDRALPTSNSKRFKNPWDLSEVRSGLSPDEFGSEIRARALDAIEVMPATNDRRREVMTDILERWDVADGRLSQQALATSSETYVRAIGKLISNNDRIAALSAEEQASVARAMSLTTGAGGYLLPFQLDPQVINVATGSFNQVRQMSKQVVATSNVWNGVAGTPGTGSWDNEAAEVSDDAPSFTQPSITICKATVFVPISMEALMDEQNVAQEVAQLIAFEHERLEAVAFVTGSGTNQPQGIITALSGGTSVVSTSTADAYNLVDLYALDNALAARWRFNASFLAHRAIYNATRQFDTSGGAALWVQLGADVPPQLLGRPAYESEAMDSTASGTNKKFMVFGDFSNYVIADRIGTTIEYIPHLFSTGAGRPTGQRGWFSYKRVGADSVNDAAFKFLMGQ